MMAGLLPDRRSRSEIEKAQHNLLDCNQAYMQRWIDMHSNLELDALIKDAASRVVIKDEMRAQQRSWVIGEMMLSHPEMTREAAEKVVDAAIGTVVHSELKKLKDEVMEWRECAQYDPLMEGQRFKGWNRSALDRCRRHFIEKDWEK
jgi:hypothetical protein